MPTRVVGTCCCGTPPFSGSGHIWVRIDATCGVVNGTRVITSLALTYIPQVPSKWQVSNVYPDRTNMQWPPNMYSSWSRGGQFYDAERTSFYGVALGALNGGEIEDQLEPENWAALITDLSSAPISMVDRPNIAANNPINVEFSTAANSYMKWLIWSDDWSLPFTHDGTNYIATFQQYGIAGRDQFIPLSFNYDANEDVTSASWYARYEFSENSFSRAPAQNSGGSGE